MSVQSRPAFDEKLVLSHGWAMEISKQILAKNPRLALAERVNAAACLFRPDTDIPTGDTTATALRRLDRGLLNERLEHVNAWFAVAKRHPKWNSPVMKIRGFRQLAVLIFDAASPGHWDSIFGKGKQGWPLGHHPFVSELVPGGAKGVKTVSNLFNKRKKHAIFPDLDHQE